MNRRERASLQSAEQPLALLRPTRSSETLIFLPTYNECDTIGRMIDALLALPIAGDVLVVDDRSTDGTTGILVSRAAAEPRLAVMVRPGKLGIGSAHILGWMHARRLGYRRIVTLDADFSHDLGPELQRWTSASTHTPPALRISVCRLGQEVRRRPRTRSASTRVQGPWQMTAAGLGPEHCLDELDGLGHRPELVGVGDSAGQDQAVIGGWVSVGNCRVYRKRVTLVEVVKGLCRAGLGGQQFRRAAGVGDGLPGCGELDLLHSLVAGQERDALAGELACHRCRPFSSSVNLAGLANG